jgi:hypothetical protein
MKTHLSCCLGLALAFAFTAARADMLEYTMKFGKLSLANAPRATLEPQRAIIENSTLVTIPITITQIPAIRRAPRTSSSVTKLYVCALDAEGTCGDDRNLTSWSNFSTFEIKGTATSYGRTFEFRLPANLGTVNFAVCADTGVRDNCASKLGSGQVAQTVAGLYQIKIASVSASEIRSEHADSLYSILIMAPGGTVIPEPNLQTTLPVPGTFAGSNFAWTRLNVVGANPSYPSDYGGESKIATFTPRDHDTLSGVEGSPQVSYPVATVVLLNYGATYSPAEQSALNKSIFDQINSFSTVNNVLPNDIMEKINSLSWRGCDGPLVVDRQTIPIVQETLDGTRPPNQIMFTVKNSSVTPVGHGCHMSLYDMTWTVGRSTAAQ